MAKPPVEIPPSELRKIRTKLKDALASLEEVIPEAELKPLTSVVEGIDALGGTAEVGRICGVSMQSVSDWKSNGFFATNTYLVLSERLRAIGYDAPPHLWRMKEGGSGPTVQSSTKDD